MKQIIIGFCGLPGSGKSTALEAIEDLGKIINMGNIIREEASNQNLKPTGENLGKIAKNLRKEEGPAVIANKTIEKIKDLSEQVIFVDGLRSVAELNEFRKHWEFPLIAVILEEDKRLKRIKERGRKDDSKSIEQIKKRDKREKRFGLEELIDKADYTISNNSTKTNLEKKTRELVLKIIKDRN